MKAKNYSRREAIQNIGLLGLGTLLLSSFDSFSFKEKIQERMIPSSGEMLPIVGLGTWQTFDVGFNSPQIESLKQVLKEMNSKGGKLIDTSPMYGNSEKILGYLTKNEKFKNDFFYATKVWTSGKQSGIAQMNSSMKKMSRDSMDLIQIHNLVDWKVHAKTLRDWKEIKKIKYWGITHYTNSSHSTLKKIIESEKPDFVQFNYSINDRNAENGLLQVAKENQVAVIINRPYGGGTLFRKVRGKKLPEWCKENDIHSWGQFFLKYLLANEAVNCVIPGTSKPHHMIDNMMAGYGSLPDTYLKNKMIKTIETI